MVIWEDVPEDTRMNAAEVGRLVQNATAEQRRRAYQRALTRSPVPAGGREMTTPLPTLTGLTCWSVGRREPEKITAERPGQFSIEIMFDDPEATQAWCCWLMANDPAWRDAG
jgi:hypothetical protein